MTTNAGASPRAPAAHHPYALVDTYVRYGLLLSGMDAALKALAEPRRRAILRLVRDGELAAGEIAARFEVTRPAISQHLRVLKEADLVTERRDGTRRLYRAHPETVAELRQFLDDFWSERLERLRDAAEAAEETTRRGDARPETAQREERNRDG